MTSALPTFILQTALSPFSARAEISRSVGIFILLNSVSCGSCSCSLLFLSSLGLLCLPTSLSLLFSHCCFHFPPFSDQSDMFSSVLRDCPLTPLNRPLQQGRTGQSCRTCWLTSETRRTCLTCSRPRLRSPGPARSGSTSTKGTERTKVPSSANANLTPPPLNRSFKWNALFGSQWRR